MKNHISCILCLVAGLSVFSSCLDIKLDNQFSDPHAITTPATARELLASAYNSLPRYQLELSVLSDDFVPTRYALQYAELHNLYQWQDKAIDDLSSLVWNDYYLTVAYLNALLARLGGVQCENEADVLEVEKVRSEALVLKALCYFDLLRLYAPPYSPATELSDGIILKNRLELDFLPRSSVRDCVMEIDRLFKEAAKTENTGAPVYYLGTEAQNALRAEFELYRGNYGKVVDFGLPLLADLESKLTSDSFSELWSVNPSTERLFAPTIFDPFYISLNYDREKGDYFSLSPKLNYQDEDTRKEWSEYQTPMEGVKSLGKYNRMYYENSEVRYVNSLRYAGVCLDVAEAYARNNATKSAIDLMNRYLNARGLPDMDSSLEGDELVEAILAERQKEFVGEGVRYFDLKRTAGVVSRQDVSGKPLSSIGADDYRRLFPIPQSEYKYNPNITEADQNPGWPYQKTE